ncbi:MAG: hypothetical protein LBS56_09455 [Propionibacteriaceae bacterium]|jgi:hypothetical protein|nr:hypothetical protein [Propionibacteriaceae bacterium]
MDGEWYACVICKDPAKFVSLARVAPVLLTTAPPSLPEATPLVEAGDVTLSIDADSVTTGPATSWALRSLFGGDPIDDEVAGHGLVRVLGACGTRRDAPAPPCFDASASYQLSLY